MLALPAFVATAAPVSVSPPTSASSTVAPNSTGYLAKKIGEGAGLGSDTEVTDWCVFAMPDASGKLQLKGEGMDNVMGWDRPF
ncbi:hypothetical protein VA596_00590 [Amycolatopsis sp., V23-08]|uniref:Uncharacterized protein n=1 Tax=Amycolatopsis heterodermiae TaxID=3110235 RepID=A0ABU5QWW0_9PSEU|nr:hypothetical protein [Amycolatopsis sp., V23-08]MEA5358015.1 hypothetical protein [Amycolatopsis sp., V23-08]